MTAPLRPASPSRRQPSHLTGIYPEGGASSWAARSGPLAMSGALVTVAAFGRSGAL